MGPIALLLQQYGYAALVLILFLDSMGVPWPTEFTLVLAGVAARAANLHIALVFVAAVSGATAGSFLSFTLGRRMGPGLLQKIGAIFRLTPEHLGKVDEWFRKHGDKAVFFGRFIPFVRNLAGYPAGVSTMDLSKYMVFSVAGYAGYIAFALFMGYAGSALARVMADLEIVLWIAIPVLLVFAWQKWGRKWQQRRRGKG